MSISILQIPSIFLLITKQVLSRYLFLKTEPKLK